MPQTTQRHTVCRASELPPGERKIVEINGRSIGVFNVHGNYHALRNICPHQMAPLCQGKVTGTTLPSKPNEYQWDREGEIVRCPWHGWEFDILTGKSVFNPHKLRVKTYKVTIEQDDAQARSGACPASESGEDPSVETFPVSVEDGLVVLHV
ncbi:Rieske (2Fe-2S) protein [Phycisphaerales bacterium AB-hyl4]|uniref:Rieske (2Fe-2S) protein n=1 Tax=Natronomicrosphaera hydrolytica TaxID=3242702 RepID=A0ABV4U6Q2_9BACT